MTHPRAVGIHAHPTLKTGRRPFRPERPKIRVGPFLNPDVLPWHPDVNPFTEDVLTYPMDRNDEAGDCVVAGSDHALELVHALLNEPYLNWSDDQLLAYYQTQNPDFHSWADAGSDADQGMWVDQFLSYLVKDGTILGYGLVDHTNREEVRAAQYIGLSLVTGEDLQVAQQRTDTWDYVKGSPGWGGHCTCWETYDQDRFGTVSWGSNKYAMTDAFIANRVEEVYLLITPAHIRHPGFRDNFDLAGFAAAFEDITGQPFPVDVPTPPEPDPVPPAPVRTASYTVPDEINAHIVRAAGRQNESPQRWVDHTLAKHFNLPDPPA